MKKNANKLFLVAGLLAMSAVLLTGCGSRKKTDAVDSVIKISTAPEPTATPDPKTVDPYAVTTNGNLTMVNEYLAGQTASTSSDTASEQDSEADSTQDSGENN